MPQATATATAAAEAPKTNASSEVKSESLKNCPLGSHVYDLLYQLKSITIKPAFYIMCFESLLFLSKNIKRLLNLCELESSA